MVETSGYSHFLTVRCSCFVWQRPTVTWYSVFENLSHEYNHHHYTMGDLQEDFGVGEKKISRHAAIGQTCGGFFVPLLYHFLHHYYPAFSFILHSKFLGI